MILQIFEDERQRTKREVPMDVVNHQQAERDAQRIHDDGAELVERLARTIREDGTIEPLPGLRLNRISVSSGPVHSVTMPSFCVIAQGSKEVLLGDSRYRYDPFHYL